MIDPQPGEKYGRLSIIKESLRIKSRRMVLCHCECGSVKVFDWYLVSKGLTISCGCIKKERAALFPRKQI